MDKVHVTQILKDPTYKFDGLIHGPYRDIKTTSVGGLKLIDYVGRVYNETYYYSVTENVYEGHTTEYWNKVNVPPAALEKVRNEVILAPPFKALLGQMQSLFTAEPVIAFAGCSTSACGLPILQKAVMKQIGRETAYFFSSPELFFSSGDSAGAIFKKKLGHMNPSLLYRISSAALLGGLALVANQTGILETLKAQASEYRGLIGSSLTVLGSIVGGAFPFWKAKMLPVQAVGWKEGFEGPIDLAKNVEAKISGSEGFETILKAALPTCAAADVNSKIN